MGIARSKPRSRSHTPRRTSMPVLALVVLAVLQAGPAAAVGGDGDADLQQLLAVAPAADLRADDGRLAVSVADLQQAQQRVRRGLGVVVEDPDPLHRRLVAAAVAVLVVAGRRRGLQRVVDRGAEAGVGLRLEHRLGTEVLVEDRQRVVLRAGVDGEDPLRGAELAQQALERVVEPARAVVRHDDGGDDVPREGVDGGFGRGAAARLSVGPHGELSGPGEVGSVLPGVELPGAGKAPGPVLAGARLAGRGTPKGRVGFWVL